ncbi:probable glycerol-3-phosphate acyltransferase 3 [Triticum dicoccoides]|uniref:probable glycerol-3-phosphate acyltransferase 3 n=1 Tax=Triticum dicoccoides TaxID=85692 RepID=UPI001233A074|nr:probable glycerol-3-phosphate acyltransferase 3 [Triticum dicoccoides]
MSKAFTKSLLLYNKILIRRLKSLITRAPPAPASATERLPPSHKHESSTAPLDALPAPGTTDDDNDNGGRAGGGTIVCEVEGGLLMSSSTFPYFMLVVLEAGGLLRGLLLLLLYPLLRLLTDELAMKAMVMVTFAGLRKDAFGRLGMAVMPKLFLQDVSAEVFHAATSAPVTSGGARRRRRCVCVSSMPRAMVEPFLKEYLAVDAVIAPELRELGGYYLGLVEDEGEVARRMDVEEVIGAKGGAVVGIGGQGCSFQHIFQKYCKEVYVPTESTRRRREALHPRRYPKPLVFHDGRTAFRPTPAATLAMFMWLPLGAPLAVLRTAVFLLLPFSLSVPLLASLGMHNRMIASSSPSAGDKSKSNLFACNHRSLLDPLCVSAAAGRRDLSAATYSISRLSEMLAPIPTFRLTRDRAADRAAMQAQLARRGLVVCPEGTTCREPFLLRFSPLFAELAAGGVDVVPVALHLAVDMFHGTTARGRKMLDPLYLLMNPVPSYLVQFLDPVECGGQEARAVANEVQRRVAEALGYERTGLTRRDKYLILAGNEGVVGAAQDGGTKN